MEDFTCKAARDSSLVVGLGLAMVIETVALHLWLARNHPVLAWSLTAASVLTIGWLAATYYALGRALLRINVHTLDWLIPRRAAVRIPLHAVANVSRPTWREVPASGTPESREYRNLLKPATPNLLVTLVSPMMIHLPGGFVRPLRKLGLKLDDPDGFIAAFNFAYASVGTPHC